MNESLRRYGQTRPHGPQAFVKDAGASMVRGVPAKPSPGQPDFGDKQSAYDRSERDGSLQPPSAAPGPKAFANEAIVTRQPLAERPERANQAEREATVVSPAAHAPDVAATRGLQRGLQNRRRPNALAKGQQRAFEVYQSPVERPAAVTESATAVPEKALASASPQREAPPPVAAAATPPPAPAATVAELQYFASRGHSFAQALLQPEARWQGVGATSWLISRRSGAIPVSRPFAEGGFSEVRLGKKHGEPFVLRTSYFDMDAADEDGRVPGRRVRTTPPALFANELIAMALAKSPRRPTEFWGTPGWALSYRLPLFAADGWDFFRAAAALSARERSALVLKVADSVLYRLADLHAASWLHRDIKPENILLKEGRIELADFGLASPQATMHVVGDMPGTRLYQSPELHKDARSRDQMRSAPYGSDLFALGLTLRDMALSGTAPAGASRKRQLDLLKVGPRQYERWQSVASLPSAHPNGSG